MAQNQGTQSTVANQIHMVNHSHGPPPGFDSNFKQQRQASYYPEHGAVCVSIILAVCAIVFIPIGAVVINATDSVYRKQVRYDDINKCTINDNQGISTFTVGADTSTQGCITQAVFTVDKTVPAPVYIYYRIVGMHQNYRDYYESRDDAQLMDGIAETITEDCEPFTYPGQITGASNKNFEYNPCGSIAWSMFNDTISLYTVPVGTLPGTTIPGTATAVCLGGAFDTDGTSTDPTNSCVKKGIALEIDRESRFTAPKTGANQWTGLGAGTEAYRSDGFYLNEPGHRLPISNDEDFMVWSRAAAFPDFVKLYRQINVDLQPGTYLLNIEEYWDSTRFEGKKYAVIATQSWLGGKHEVLGIALLTFGCASFVLAVGFILHNILGEGRRAS